MDESGIIIVKVTLLEDSNKGQGGYCHTLLGTTDFKGLSCIVRVFLIQNSVDALLSHVLRTFVPCVALCGSAIKDDFEFIARQHT